MTLPFIEDCAGYHLFGTSEAASVANIVNPAKPLIKVGTPTYPTANYAEINFNAERQGFRTTDSFSNRNTTKILIATWPRNAADTGYGALQIKTISQDDGNQFLLWIAGTDHQFITGTGTGISDALTNNRRPSFNQDNDIGVRPTGPHRYALMATVDTGTEARMTIQEGYQLKQFTGTPAASAVSSPIFFGGQGFLGDAVCRFAACAYFTRALDFAEISAVWEAMLEDLAARPQQLRALSLSGSTIAENSAPGTVVGALAGWTDGAVLSLANDAGGRFAIAGRNVVAGLVATDFETATSHSITVRETLAGASNTPRDSTFTVTVTNVIDGPSLAALTLPASAATGLTIAITGATPGSTITGTLPSGWTLNSAARTITIASSAAFGAQSWTLVETLADSPNSPRTSTGSSTVVPLISFLAAPLDSRITFTRVSSATRFNAAGVLEAVGNDVARFDYDPVTLQPRGLLIEEQRTNLLLQSEDFTTSWAATRVTVAANVAIAPDGTSTADKLVDDNSNNSHFVNQGVASVAANSTVATSIFAKADGRNFLAFVTQNQGGSFLTSYFNLSNGTIGTVAAGHTASIQSIGNGWYRCTIVATQTAVTGSFNFYPGASAVDGSTIYQGNGTSGILVWGAQMEIGAFATSYIPTTSATVTRALERAAMTGTNFSSWFNPTAGTFYAEFAKLNNVANGRIFTMSDNTPNQQIRITGNVGATVNPSWQVINGGATQANIANAPQIAVGSVGKVAAVYAANDFALAVNGGLGTPDTSGTIPTVDRLWLGADTGDGVPLNGYIRSIRYFPTRLSNAQLQALTA